jgi:mono/diheme cytochrome c family protein
VVVAVHRPALPCLLLLVAPLGALGQTDPERPGYLPREIRDRLVPGLRVEFESPPAGLPSSPPPAQRAETRSTDVRIDRLPALFVPTDAPPTPFLPAGPFRATFSGYLRLPIRGTYEFRFAGSGTATLSFDGRDVLAAGPGDLAAAAPVAVDLLKGYNTLRLTYASPPDGDATLRLYWRSEEFPWEPLPVEDLSCDGTDALLRHGLDLRVGRKHFANHMCSRCHASAVDPHVAGFAGMPELAHDAPSLADAGRRLEPAWVAAWLRDPTAVRNNVTMPSLLHGLDDAAARTAAADLATYIGSLTTSEPPASVDANDERLEQGGFLYETRGCIACHRFNEPAAEDEFDRTSLRFVAAKFRAGALARFLVDSRAHYRWSRMPKFDFTAEEAASLEVFLRSKSTGELAALDGGDAARGKDAFAKTRCGQCHAVGPDALPKPSLAAIDTAKLNTGCLAATVAAGVPDFRTSDDDRRALADFLANESRDASLTRVVPNEFSRRTVAAVGCVACHARDESDAALPLLAVEEGDLGLLPDQVPGLTWVGEKLKPAWSRELLAGTLGYRLRDHFRARMPAFPARAEHLATGLSMEHGFDPPDDPAVTFDPDLAKIGRAVAAPQTGLSCIRCHPIADQPPTAPEQALSTNLSFTRGRMREEFYTRWMFLPQRIEYNTRMIRFAPDGRKTGLDTIYDGDARQQYEAMWHWLGELHAERVGSSGGK